MTSTVTAPLKELLTRPHEVKNGFRAVSGALLFILTFPQQLKELSSCYVYFEQHNGSLSFWGLGFGFGV